MTTDLDVTKALRQYERADEALTAHVSLMRRMMDEHGDDGQLPQECYAERRRLGEARERDRAHRQSVIQRRRFELEETRCQQ